MSYLSMAPIHGQHSVSHGDYKLHDFLQHSGWTMTLVKGILIECEFLPLPKDGHTLLHCSTIPQEMFEILYFMGGNPLHHHLKHGIFLFCSYPVGYMQVYACVSSPCLDYSFFNLPMYAFVGLSDCQLIDISPSYGSYGDPFQDGLHSFCAQLRCNMAQSICYSIVSSLLILDAKCESCQWLHPSMLGGISIGSSQNVGKWVIFSFHNKQFPV